jgi:hypothetical protein
MDVGNTGADRGMRSGDIEIPSDKILYLLDEVCRTLGFCLPPKEKLRISEAVGWNTQSLTDEILTVSGFVPECEEQWRNEIKSRLCHYFQRGSQS